MHSPLDFFSWHFPLLPSARVIREGLLAAFLPWGSDSRQPSQRVERWIEINQNDGIDADVLLENLEIVP
jgi:hypothetical protein